MIQKKENILLLSDRSKISSIPNHANSTTLQDFYEYMRVTVHRTATVPSVWLVILLLLLLILMGLFRFQCLTRVKEKLATLVGANGYGGVSDNNVGDIFMLVVKV